MRKKKNYQKTEHWKILYGMFTNWGLLTISVLVSIWIRLILNENIVLPITYLIISLGFYFPIKNLRDYKTGYILAFIVGEISLAMIYYMM